MIELLNLNPSSAYPRYDTILTYLISPPSYTVHRITDIDTGGSVIHSHCEALRIYLFKNISQLEAGSTSKEIAPLSLVELRE